jgi:CheY-like chemotaxis protein
MKILVVDEEPGVAEALARSLADAGCGECFAADSARDGVEIVNREQGIDLLVTAVFMDDIDGFTLHETLREYLPDLRVIFLSGYDLSEHAARVGGWPVLPRPVEPAALIAEVVRLLENEAATGSAPSTENKADAAKTEAPPVPDALVGTTLAGFQIEARLGDDASGPVYKAVQTSIGRTVELHALHGDLVADAARVERFLADARVKANVHQPALLSVFEAGRDDGVVFYTSEERGGDALPELAASGAKLPPTAILGILRTVTDAMVHLGQARVAHEPLQAAHVIIDRKHRARLVNLATSAPGGATTSGDMRALAGPLLAVLGEGEMAKPVRELLFEMESEATTVRSWTALLFEVNRVASGNEPTHAFDSHGQSGVEAVAAYRRRQRRVRLIGGLVTGALVVAGLLGAAWYLFPPKLGNPAFDKMLAIPAGKTADAPQFWIDAYEVTIGQYADFLAWAKRNPGQAAALTTPDLPPPAGHSFVPAGWASEKDKPGYFEIARNGGDYHGAKLSLASPVFGVDWFDAYAYALWKGRRLPTEEEWDRATIGPDGQPNLHLPARKSAVVEKLADVNALGGDVSPLGVAGLAGNVAEWTFSFEKEAKTNAVRAVARGGDFASGADLRRRQTLSPSTQSPAVGFRTASDQAP